MTRGYHHGDLARALVDVGLAIIEEQGLSAFSVSEACRRLNVSQGAPYRHFPDRNSFLSAIAVRALAVLAEYVTVSCKAAPDPLERLSRSVTGYVIFAARHPALFEVVFSKEVLIGTNPRLRDAIRPIVEAFVLPTYELPGISEDDAGSVVVAAAAIAHGYGAFIGVGNFDTAEVAFGLAARKAGQAVKAMILGPRNFYLLSAEPSMTLAGLPFHSWIEELGITPSRSRVS